MHVEVVSFLDFAIMHALCVLPYFDLSEILSSHKTSPFHSASRLPGNRHCFRLEFLINKIYIVFQSEFG